MAKTTFVVSFGEAPSGSDGVVMELEPSMNDDKTSFSPGEEVHFVIHYPQNRRVVSVLTTSGEAFFVGRQEFSRSQDAVFFQDVDTVINIPHTPSSAISISWFGTVGELNISGRDIRVNNPPCIGDLEYKMVADLYRYVPSIQTLEDGEDFVVGVVAAVEEL